MYMPDSSTDQLLSFFYETFTYLYAKRAGKQVKQTAITFVSFSIFRRTTMPPAPFVNPPLPSKPYRSHLSWHRLLLAHSSMETLPFESEARTDLVGRLLHVLSVEGCAEANSYPRTKSGVVCESSNTAVIDFALHIWSVQLGLIG